MNTILRNTHAKRNIEIIMAREYYFNIAKKLNRIKTTITFTPPALLLLSYVPFIGEFWLFSGFYWDFIIGALTVMVIVSSFILDYYIDSFSDISNMLREYYDHKVLGLKFNRFLYDADKINTYIQKARKVQYASKYEVWYSEAFSGKQAADIFCCQLDNLLYAKHAYKKTKQHYARITVLFTVLISLLILYTLLRKDFVGTVLIAFSVIECYDIFISRYFKVKDALDACTVFCDHAIHLQPSELNDGTLDEVQEVVVKNRNMNIFLPPSIRNAFLQDDNPFYRELNLFKNKFMGDDTVLPETAEELEIVFEDGSDAVALAEIQERLHEMLKKIVAVFDAEGITYTLDGGTLIGAMRASTRGFIPWDDDIDIALPADQIEKAKAALRTHLDYVVQDAENEAFYSPRLAAFRIRESNADSVVSEKDSPLYVNYENRGLFVDVYAFSPVLCSVAIDKLFRKAVIHPANRSLKRLEDKYFMWTNRHIAEKRFFKLKKKYTRILSFYKKHANNHKQYVYSPEYIHNLEKPGPYHLREDLYADTPNYAIWEGVPYKVPADPDKVLRGYYGADWQTPPFKRKAQLVQEYGDRWYSKAPTKVSALKHISHLVHLKR